MLSRAAMVSLLVVTLVVVAMGTALADSRLHARLRRHRSRGSEVDAVTPHAPAAASTAAPRSPAPVSVLKQRAMRLAQLNTHAQRRQRSSGGGDGAGAPKSCAVKEKITVDVMDSYSVHQPERVTVDVLSQADKVDRKEYARPDLVSQYSATMSDKVSVDVLSQADKIDRKEYARPDLVSQYSATLSDKVTVDVMDQYSAKLDERVRPAVVDSITCNA